MSIVTWVLTASRFTSYAYDVCFYADNHDILSMKLFDLDKDGEPHENQEETANIVPRAIKAAAYRGKLFGQVIHGRGIYKLL